MHIMLLNKMSQNKLLILLNLSHDLAKYTLPSFLPLIRRYENCSQIYQSKQESIYLDVIDHFLILFKELSYLDLKRQILF